MDKPDGTTCVHFMRCETPMGPCDRYAYQARCEGCGALMKGGRYCSGCKEKLRLWTEIQALVLGCKRSEVRTKRQEYWEKKKNG